MKRGKIIDHSKVVFFTAFFCALCFSAFAQPGLQEIGDATREVKRSYNSLVNLCYAVGAITGLVGGARVYSNWNTGKHHIDAQVVGWFLSCIFFQLVAILISALYGV